MDTQWLNAAKEKFIEFQREIWAEHEGDPPINLYHYTPEKGFRGIITSKTLRVFDIDGLKNDPTEGRYSMALLCPLAARKSVPQQVFEAYQLADTLFGVSEFWYEYVACFSEAKYSQHQWKKYADEGRGFALVIDSERLTEDARGEYAPVRILYDKPEQVRKANSTIDHAINIARELNVPKRYLVDFWLSGPAAQSLLLSALRIKDPGQENEKEREWRVLMLRPDRNGAIKGLTAGGLETYYMELRLTPSLLRRVVLGPTCNWSEQEARSFLDEHGFTETIVERDLPCADGATCASLAVPHPPCAQDS